MHGRCGSAGRCAEIWDAGSYMWLRMFSCLTTDESIKKFVSPKSDSLSSSALQDYDTVSSRFCTYADGTTCTVNPRSFLSTTNLWSIRSNLHFARHISVNVSKSGAALQWRRLCSVLLYSYCWTDQWATYRLRDSCYAMSSLLRNGWSTGWPPKSYPLSQIIIKSYSNPPLWLDFFA